MLKDDKVIHEERPEGKIVGSNVFEFDMGSDTKAIEAASVEEASVPVIEEISVEVVVEVTIPDETVEA